MPMTEVISGFFTPKDNTKSNCLGWEKSQNLIKICGKFLSQCHLEEGVFTPKGLPVAKHGNKMNTDYKSASWKDKFGLDV